MIRSESWYNRYMGEWKGHFLRVRSENMGYNIDDGVSRWITGLFDNSDYEKGT